MTCPSCGQENPEGFGFCGRCGAELAVAGRVEVRKTVTIVFCDLVGSTSLGERSDPEVLRATMGRYHAELRAVLERHGGTVEKFVGDAAMAIFGLPQVHEDDALRAVRAAFEMRETVVALGLEVRIGVNTGEVVAGAGETLATGDAVNVAARLEQAAAPGEVLLGELTVQLVRGAVEVDALEPLHLKGKAEPVAAYRLLRVGDAPERTHATRFVGRARELTTIREAFDRAYTERRCELVTILGEAGVGKSRLVAEALGSSDARVLRGRCLPYGEGITYWPVVEVLKQLDLRPSDAAAVTAIAALLGESETHTTAEEIAWAFRKTLEHAAEERPVVVVFDDIQWGEQTFHDLIEHIALLSQGAPILVLCMARPELVEHRSTWPVTLRLEPLPAPDVDELIGNQVAGDLRERIVHASGGNPLFLAEMLAMVDETEGDVAVPPTLHALLAARLDQLETSERSLLEAGSIEGEVFHRGAVQALVSAEEQITPRLASLVRKELIRPDRPQFPREDGFRFRHLLLRDTAYGALPKTVRAELHQSYATWLDEHGTELVELDELVGYHLEQASRYREELGSLDPALGELAATRLRAAAHGARSRGDVTATVNLLGRAASLASEGQDRARLLIDLAEASAEAGDTARAERLLDEAMTLGRASGDAHVEWLARVILSGVRSVREPDGAAEAMLREAEAAIAAREPAADNEVLARAWKLVADARAVFGRITESAPALDRAAEYARLAGDTMLEASCTYWKAPYFVFGPGRVAEGLHFADVVLEPLRGVPGVQAFALHVRGHMRARLGDFEGAFEDIVEYRRRLREVGRDREYAVTSGCLWDVCLWAGEWERGETALREAYEMLERAGNKAFLSEAALDLGDAVLRQGRLDEAERWSEIGEEVTTEDDVFGTARWLTLKARVTAARGDLGGAESSARRAVDLALDDEYPEVAADARQALAEVLRLAGSPEAPVVAAEALALYERKGNLVGAARVREFIAAAG